jgi:hypothetical protein
MATTKVSKGLIKDEAITIEKLNNALVVTAAEGIINNDNDLTVPTSAAVKQYVDDNVVVGGVTSFTATNGTFITLTPNTSQTGAATLTANLSATGTPDATTFLRGDNQWVTVAGTTYDYSSAQSGDNVNLNLIPSSGDIDTVTLVAGSNIQLINSGNSVTINATSEPIPTVLPSDFVFINVKNETGSTIPLGTGLMAVGSDGNSGHILVAPMVADGSIEPKYYIGVLEEDLSNGGFGRAVTQGEVDQINTNAFPASSVLWCDPANPGGFTTTEPSAPNVKIATAIVLSSKTNGKIFVRVQGNEGLHELHDVGVSGQTDGQILSWDATLGYWKNIDLPVSTLVQDDYVGDGIDTTFQLSVTPFNELFTTVYLAGVYQEKNTYSLSGDTVTFTTAPPNGVSIEVMTITNPSLSGVYTAGTGITLTGGEFSIGQPVGATDDVQFGSLGVGTAPIPGGLNVSGFINVASPSGASEIMGINGNLISDDLVSGDFILGAGFINANPANATFSLASGGPAFMSYDGSIQLTTFEGAIAATGDVIAYYSSDERLKENIKPIENALEKVSKLGGYEFDWNEKQNVYEGHDIGVIAQEVEAVFPELVTDRDNGFKAVKYEKLVAVLIESVKELSAKVKTLESKLQ